MKKIDLGQSISILANIGVIAGIILLALELNQSNRLLEAQAISAAIESRIARQDLFLNNQYLLEMDANSSETDLESQANYRMGVRTHLGWQKEFFLWRAGVLNEDLFRANIQGLFDTPSGSEFWERWKRNAAPDFREFVETCLFLECESFPR